ncbi:MAG: SDR family oxidoreductase [Bacteroidales bacterium]|nr:SDR family oxidoreductase [Bacteroidales bacterium]
MCGLFSLIEKNIIITGASSGIGRQCAISCSQMGANVVLIARNEERLKKTYNSLERGNHLYFPQDITEYDKIELVINETVSRLGKIHGFIHSAGIEMTLPLKILNSTKFEKVYSINVISAFNIARIISKKKYIGENASFVFISSIMAQLGQPGKIGYCSSKGALIAGAKAMALELANRKIRVNSILPGMVKSEMSNNLLNTLSDEAKNEIEKMHPYGIGSVDDVANACIYLLSDASKWVTGTNLIVDGGYSAK